MGKRSAMRTLAGAACLALAAGADAGTVVTELNVRQGGPGNETVHGLQLDRDGGFVVSGFSAPSSAGVGGTQKYSVTRYDSYGRQKWSSEYWNGGGYGEASALALDRAGNAYIAMSEAGTFSKIVRFDPDGNQTLFAPGETVGYNIDRRVGLKTDAAGNVYVYGAFLVKKYNAAGALQWRRQFQPYFANFVRDLVIDAAGNVYAVGYGIDGSNRNAPTDVVVAKFDANGTSVWSRIHDRGATDQGVTAALDSAGNLVVLAYAASSPNVGIDTAVVLTYDASGNLLRQHAHSYGTQHVAVAMKLMENDTAVVTAAVNGDIVTAAYRPDGSEAWQQRYAGPWGDSPLAMDVDPLGNVVVVGASEGYPHWSNNRYITLKYDANGALGFTKIDVYGVATAVRIGPTGEIYVAGSTYYPFDALTLRYREFTGVCP